jgi:hypothetical protein
MDIFRQSDKWAPQWIEDDIEDEWMRETVYFVVTRMEYSF